MHTASTTHASFPAIPAAPLRYLRESYTDAGARLWWDNALLAGRPVADVWRTDPTAVLDRLEALCDGNG